MKRLDSKKTYITYGGAEIQVQRWYREGSTTGQWIGTNRVFYRSDGVAVDQTVRHHLSINREKLTLQTGKVYWDRLGNLVHIEPVAVDDEHFAIGCRFKCGDDLYYQEDGTCVSCTDADSGCLDWNDLIEEATVG